MPRYKPYDYNQNKMMVVDYEAQLQPGTFEHALHHVRDNKLDLSIFDTRYHNASSAFRFDPKALTCLCPAGAELALRREQVDKRGNRKLFFEGYLLKCRACELKHQCLRNPRSADHRHGHGRQVSFILQKGVRPGNYYTSWMRARVDHELRGGTGIVGAGFLQSRYVVATVQDIGARNV